MIGAIEIFVFRQGRFAGSRMFSADRTVTIGRAPDCSLKLEDDEVSSRHATLRVIDGHLIIADTGSRNGVFVNGQKVQSAEVTSFDEIYVGGCRLKVETVGGPQQQQAPDYGAAGGPERTRISTTPFARPGEDGPSGTAPRLPAVAAPPAPEAPSTTPFMRPIADPAAAAPPAPARPAAPPTRGRTIAMMPAAPDPYPVVPPPAAAPRTPRFDEGRAPEAPSFDEDARTASVEFAPPAEAAPAHGGAAAGSYWDFDEDQATVPGRAGKNAGLDQPADPSHATRPLPAIMDPAVMPAGLKPIAAAPAARAPEPAAPAGLPFPVVAPMAAAPRPATATAPTPPPAFPASPAPPTEAEVADPTSQVAVPVAARAGAADTGRVRRRAEVDSAAQTFDENERPLPPRAIPFTEEDELEEDEVEERDWFEPFSLLENVLRDHPKAPAGAAGVAVLEVIRYRGRCILDVARLHRGADMDIFAGGEGQPRGGAFKLIKLHGDGRAQLFFTESTEGSVVLAGVTTPLRDLCVDDRLYQRAQRVYSVMLCEGDYAQILMEGGGGFLTRFVRPPPAPPHHFGSDLSATDLVFMGCGLATVAVVIVGLWVASFFAGPAEIRLQEEELNFAQVSLKEAALEKPAEEKKIETPEPVNAEMPQLEKIKVAAAAPKRVRSPGPATGGGGPGPPTPQKPAGVLSALNDIRPAADSGDNALRAAVSNIAAVRVPTGTSAGFQVTGTFSKLGGGEVRLATGGGGGGGKGRETRVGAELFRGEKGAKAGALTGGGGGGKIRGTVRSAGRPTTKGGVLDAAAVQRVVTEHLAAVQACYERQLLKDPGLQGKLTFDWDVAPGGAVSSARMASSSMGTGGGAVAACIVNEIRRWRFPSPIGGTASVRYPFIFRMSGF